MTINISIDIISLVLLIVLVGVPLFMWLLVLYYERLAVQIEWRLAAAKAISKQIKKMKKEYKFTQKQKDFLNDVLASAHDSKFVRQFLKTISQAKRTAKHNGVESPVQMGKSLKIEKSLGIKDHKTLADIELLLFLCMVHASTHSFFSGFKLRKEVFSYFDFIVGSQKSAKQLVKEPVVIGKIVSHKNNLSGGEILSFMDNNFFGGRQTA